MKQYSASGFTGCVVIRTTRQTGHDVGVYYGPQADIATSADAPWVTCCEEHGIVIEHQTLKLALGHASDPKGWCEECRKDTFRCSTCGAEERTERGGHRCPWCGEGFMKENEA
jgi:hypothetical protein